MSKLLRELDSEISRSADDGARGVLLARKAGYLARIGKFDEAQSIITDLRAALSDGRSPRASIWIMLAEGLLHTFRDMSDAGADRFMRAQALANATKDRSLIAATSAWRAFAQSERSEFKGMVRSLDDALANCDNADHEVLARVYMILGNAYMSVGERLLAHDLYMYSRHHALECGDQATIDGVIYNKAAFAIAWLRAQTCLGGTDQEHQRQLRLELASAKTYQQMIGVDALSNFVYLWEARLQLVADEFEAAAVSLGSVRSMKPFAKYNYDVSLIDLETAYCLHRAGKGEDALALAKTAFQTDLSGLHDDDRLVAAWLRKELAAAYQELGDLADLTSSFERARDQFSAGVDELRGLLASVKEHTHIARPHVAHAKPVP
jgi:tetratricopeptide (TPR) repeat protein